MFASPAVAYALWALLGWTGAHRFYVGRPVSGFVWLFTVGLFGVGWVIDFFLIPQFVEENNKRVFHQQMLETGNSLLFDGDYGGGAASAPYYPGGGGQMGGYGGGGGGTAYGAAPYANHVYYPQAGGGARGGGYEQPQYY